MTIKWTERATVKVVILYGRHECLWNPFLPEFNKQLCCYQAYKQIVRCMNIPGLTVCDCVKRISFVKKQYCFELSKISAAISRGTFYKPKASWFEIMHELLFPYIQSESNNYNDDSRKDCDCSQDEEGDGDGDGCDNENPVIDGCECPPCECPPSENFEQDRASYSNRETYLDLPHKKHHRSKSRATKTRGSSKSPICSTRSNCVERNSASDLERSRPLPKFNKHGRPCTQTDNATNTRKTTCDKGNDVIRSMSTTKCAQVSKRCIDAGNRTSSLYISQSGVQTERKSTANTYTNCEHAEKAQCTMNDEFTLDDVCIDSAEGSGKKCNQYDEFDMFGKSVACQLRSLSLESAINLEKRIQDMMTEERLCCMKDSVAAKPGSKDCTCTCNECKECCSLEKDQTCACGVPVSKCLPLFPMKPSQCYGFGCN
nr:uncharacterized protein LOC124220927 [Neodiprion pinetum]